MNKPFPTTAFLVLIAAAVYFYQPAEVNLYQCSEHPDFYEWRNQNKR